MTGLHRKTISLLIDKIISVLIPSDLQSPVKIGGPNIIVEIDESKFGKVKYHRGHRVEGVWIFWGVERTLEKKAFFAIVNDRKRETLHALIQKHVSKGSIIYTDCWRAYNGIDELGYSHQTVNHSQNFRNPITGVHTNSIEGSWSAVKNVVPKRNRTKIGIKTFLDKLFEYTN